MRLEIWDQLQCIPGSACLAVVPDFLALTWVDSKDGISSLTGQIPTDSPAAPSFGTSRILRVCWEDETALEMVLQDDTPALAADGKRARSFVAVAVDSLLKQILLREIYADGTVAYDFEKVALTPAQWIDNVILAAAAAEGMSWLGRGAVEATTPKDFTFSSETIWDFLRRLATESSTTASPIEYQLRRNGSSGYLIDLVAQIGRGATPLSIRASSNLIALSRHSSSSGQVTRCSARGTAIDDIHPGIEDARWRVKSTPSGSTAVLEDPNGGDGPIAFDSQLVLPVARYVRKIGGTLLLLTASATATQQITTSGAHGWSVGDLVEFKSDAAGTDLTYLEHPTKVQPPVAGYGLHTAMLDRPDLAGTNNLVVDPCFKQFPSSPGLPTQYQADGGLSTANISRIATQGLWQSGGQSARCQTSGDGQGLSTLYALLNPAPSAAKPYVSAFADFYNAATGSSIRAELILGKATTAVSGTPTRSTAGGVTTVLVVTSGAHGFATGDQVEVTGASPAGYNGIFTITVIDTTHFTYTLTSDPGAISGTWITRKVWILPDTGVEYSSVVSKWDTLGVAGIDANALGATVARIRLVQHGATNVDVYIDGFQITQQSFQEPFIEGCGAVRLWQACNRVIAVKGDPIVAYDSQIIDRNRLDGEAFPWESVVLGGQAVIYNSDLGILNDNVRIVEITRQLTADKVTDTQLKLATRVDEFTDPPATRTLRQNDAQPGTVPIGVSCAIVTLPADPNTVTVTLTPTAPGALVYYWAGQADQKPPLIGLLSGTNVYSPTQWGLYSGPFSLSRSATGDLRVWGYAVLANRASAPQGFQVSRALTSAVVLSLTQIAAAGGASNMKISWTVDTNVRSVQLYLKRVASPGGVLYPTVGGGSADPLDSPQYVGEFYTTADGVGVSGDLFAPGAGYAGPTGAGKAVVGSMNYIPVTTFNTNDWLAVIAIPIDRQGNVGSRASATLQCAASLGPYIVSLSQVRNDDGTACDTDGAEFQVSWAKGGTWVDATHDLALSYRYKGAAGVWSAWTSMTNVTNPNTVGSFVWQSLHKRTTAKFDPLITYQFKAELVVSAGPTIIDTATVQAPAYTSSCVPV